MSLTDSVMDPASIVVLDFDNIFGGLRLFLILEELASSKYR